MTRHRLRRLCVRCGRVRPYRGKGLCDSCGALRPYVPTGVGSGGPGVARTREVIQGRLTDFAELRQRGNTIAAAAGALGLSDRTGERYQARLNKEEGRTA